MCIDCQETFKCEEDCDNHECPAWVPKLKLKNEPKTEPQENAEGEGEGEGALGGKRNTRSTRIKKKNKLK